MKLLPILLGLMLIASCEKEPCENAQKATFKDMTGLDGCGMMIELEDGKRLEYINLNDFEITPEDGKQIWVTYENYDGMSICMAGQMVKITCIAERK